MYSSNYNHEDYHPAMLDDIIYVIYVVKNEKHLKIWTKSRDAVKKNRYKRSRDK